MIPRARWLARLTTGAAALLVLLLFAPALYQPFLVPKFAALELTASLGFVAFALFRAAADNAPRLGWTREVTLGALLVLATTFAAWAVSAGRPWGTPYALAAAARWAALLGLACGASVVDDSPESRQRLLEAVTIAAAMVAAIGLLQHLEILPLRIPVISTPGSTFGNRNLAAEVMAMALPLGVGAASGARQRGTRGAIFLALGLELVFLAVTRTRGAWFGAACGLGAAVGLARFRVSRVSGAMTVAAIALAIVAAAVPGRLNAHDAGDAKRYSGVFEVLQDGFDLRSTALRTRFGLWRRTAAMVRDFPTFGVGPGNWPVVFPLYAEPGATRDGVLSATLAPQQAHDDLLERAAETGLLGLAAVGSLAWGAAISVRRRLRWEDQDTRRAAAAAAGALVSLVALALGSFPLESPGTLALAGLALGLVAGKIKVEKGESLASLRLAPASSLASRHAVAALAVALVPFVALKAERSLRTSRALGDAERAMRRDPGPVVATEALAALSHATQATPSDFRAHLRTAQMLLRQSRPQDSATAARAALSTEPYSPNAWAALAAAELALADLTAARRAATRALGLLEDYPFALELRARAADQQGDFVSADRDRQRLTQLAAGAADDETARAARLLRGAAEGTK